MDPALGSNPPAQAPVLARPTPAFGITVVSGRYKSIAPPLSWPDIPPFAILSGLNGSGKTQLLEAIAMQFDESLQRRYKRSTVVIEFDGHKYNPHDFFYIDPFDRAFTNDSISLSNYNEAIHQLRSGNGDRAHQRFIAEQARLVSVEEFPFDSLYLDLHHVDRAIVHQFLQFLVRDSNFARKGRDRSILGDPPWEELNRSLQRSGFPYRFVAPEELSTLKPLKIELFNSETGKTVLLRDLSSGESSLMRFLLFAFAVNKTGAERKLFLLDEPDAHLHCNLIQSFLIGVQNILVESFGSRVIMTTHRTETLALAPGETLYEMHRSGERIRKSNTKRRTMGMLTSSIIGIVYGGTRAVIVEDVADVTFYQSVFGILRKYGEWQATAEPKFLAASWLVGIRANQDERLGGDDAKANKQGPKGGKGNVKVVIGELNALGFHGVVGGLVDKDDGKAENLSNTVVLERYEVENYLLDPIYIYVYLLHHNRRLPAARTLGVGAEGELREWSNEELQSIADAVCEGLSGKLAVPPSEAERRRMEVRYTNGKMITIPVWLRDRKGKELFHAARQFASPIYFGRRELEVAMQRVCLIPVDLRSALEAAVGYGGR